MGTTNITTAAGVLELVPATIDQLRGIARYWPMELIADSGVPDHFGMVFQHGDREVHGIKMQPPDVPEADAKVVHHANRALIALALPDYLAAEHRGVMVPCAYYKEKAKGMVETGIAFFVGPDGEGTSRSGGNAGVAYDDGLGAGATPMILDMAAAIAQASKAYGLPLMTPIGMDLRPRLAIGAFAMHFVVEGPRVFVVKDPLQEDEPVWEYIVRAGFSKLPYAPMKPMGLPSQPPPDARHL